MFQTKQKHLNNYLQRSCVQVKIKASLDFIDSPLLNFYYMANIFIRHEEFRSEKMMQQHGMKWRLVCHSLREIPTFIVIEDNKAWFSLVNSIFTRVTDLRCQLKDMDCADPCLRDRIYSKNFVISWVTFSVKN